MNSKAIPNYDENWRHHPSYEINNGSPATCKGLKFEKDPHKIGWHHGPNGDWYGCVDQKPAR